MSDVSFVQDISDKDSKFDDDIAENLNSLLDNEQNLVEAYESLLKDSRRMTQLNDILKGKWKTTEKGNFALKQELETAQGKVCQLETQRTILSNKLIDVGKKWDTLYKQSIKTEEELQTFRRELDTCKA